MSKKITFFSVLSIAFIVLFTTGCNVKKPATGEEDIIYVVADSSEYYQLESSLLQVFGKVIYTPQPENLFSLQRVAPNRIDNVKDKKNIIIIAPLESGSYTSQYINARLDSSVKKLVLDDSEFVFNKYDLWARNQLVSYITAPTMEKLQAKLLQNHEDLLYYFQKISDERLFESLYNEKYEKKDIEAKLLKNYGWIIYVQPDFRLAQEDADNNFVWLRRAPGSDMERWIFVHWIDNASPEFLSRDSIYAERNKMTRMFYQGTADSTYVEIEQEMIMTNEVNFLGRYALMTQGLWRMNDKSMGGPFINYTFYDEATSVSICLTVQSMHLSFTRKV